jgi:dTDP-4-dehydrorhamnose 3,5-epimerase
MVKPNKHPSMDGVKKFHHQRFIDSRGWFSQVFTTDELREIGFRDGFLQLNMSKSSFGVIRGMHRQDQSKLVQVVSGKIFDVALNPENGESFGAELGEGDSLFIPSHYAHGFMVLSSEAIVQYVVDAPWCKEKEETFAWDKYGIAWPTFIQPKLSHKDENA